jgi:hypothetical protein
LRLFVEDPAEAVGTPVGGVVDRRITGTPRLSTKVIVVTTLHDDDYVARALRDGASGFLLKFSRLRNGGSRR